MRPFLLTGEPLYEDGRVVSWWVYREARRPMTFLPRSSRRNLSAAWRAIHNLERQLTHMATQAEVDTITTEVEKVATDLTTASTTLRTEIDSLAAANPQINLSGLRTAVAPLDAAVQALGNLQPLTPEPAPAPEPT